jgi:hypothetical protein
MPNGNDSRRGAEWRVSPWAVTTASEARNVAGPKMIVPDSQANSMRLASGRPHGLCAHFSLSDGQELVNEHMFFTELLNGGLSDTAYLPEWLDKKSGYGICALIGSDTLIHALHPGTCTLDQAKAWGKAEGLHAWRRGDGDIVVCPCWQEKSAQSGKGSRRR